MQKWTYATARAEGTTRADLGLMRVEGIVTPETSLAILGDNDAWLHANGISAQVADYTGAQMAMDPYKMLDNIARIVNVSQALRAPTALVVPVDLFAYFSSYAWLMARKGIVRAVFTDRDLALDWAETQALAMAGLRAEAERRALLVRSEGTDTRPLSVRVGSC